MHNRLQIYDAVDPIGCEMYDNIAIGEWWGKFCWRGSIWICVFAIIRSCEEKNGPRSAGSKNSFLLIAEGWRPRAAITDERMLGPYAKYQISATSFIFWDFWDFRVQFFITQYQSSLTFELVEPEEIWGSPSLTKPVVVRFVGINRHESALFLDSIWLLHRQVTIPSRICL